MQDKEVSSVTKSLPNCFIKHIKHFKSKYYIFLTIFNSKDTQFYELDLPEIIKLRQQFLPEQSNDTHIASSFMDVSWTKQIDTSKPTLIVASGLFYYFKPKQVLQFMQDIRRHFKHLEIVFDVNSKIGMRISNRIVEKSGNQNAKMYFYIQNVQKFCRSISPEINTAISYPYYKDTHQILKGKIKFSTKMTMKISDWLNMVKIVKIRLC